MKNYEYEIASGTACPRNDKGERVLSGRRGKVYKTLNSKF